MPTSDRDAVMRIAQTLGGPVDETAFLPILEALNPLTLSTGETLIHAGGHALDEFFVLEGVLKTSVSDAKGREVTLGFHSGPCALPPALARTEHDRSRVDCVALTPARLAGFPARVLVECMLRNPAVQRWGDTVLRGELIRRADREWTLAALPALERLLRLRQTYPGLEDLVPHHHIASHLGVTPVTLSRLRAKLKPGSRPGEAGGSHRTHS